MEADLAQSYKAMECNMSSRRHLLDSKLDFFPEIFGAVSDDHGQKFHKIFNYGKAVPRQMESQYAG